MGTVRLLTSAINQEWQEPDRITASQPLPEISTTTAGPTSMWPAIPLPAFCSATITTGRSRKLPTRQVLEETRNSWAGAHSLWMLITTDGPTYSWQMATSILNWTETPWAAPSGSANYSTGIGTTASSRISLLMPAQVSPSLSTATAWPPPISTMTVWWSSW